MNTDLDAPYLRLDPAVLETNIRNMARSAAARGLSLWPHAKTHKSREVARRQLDAGAAGLTVATVGEAEVFAALGVPGLFIAYPLWVTGDRARRLQAVASQTQLRIGVDSLPAAQQLARFKIPAEVMIEVDSGHHRSGCRPAAAGELAAQVSALGLAVAGVSTFPGHSYAPGQGTLAADDERLALAAALDRIQAAGVPAELASGGSSPSAAYARSSPSAAYARSVLTDIRPGVYVFNDAQQLELGVCGLEDIALSVVATVVSKAGGRVILDSGTKSLGADRPAWTTGHGRLLEFPDARITAASEHHATVEMSGPLPALGTRVLVAPNHACNAVNLHDRYVLSTAASGSTLDPADELCFRFLGRLLGR
ncbi:alanine racemase [Arthrobacter sp. ATA002]|uniref:alanine racemase n=1 Tax=Arthrobacter sp. ATA002 TaxID=2991715 RepID=UPI0022A65E6A|nr:alanine racemase [Arthrobacter sp. ATA002]WAP50534.1 alanine racemase [Arthrobacter sp. ATA002]